MRPTAYLAGDGLISDGTAWPEPVADQLARCEDLPVRTVTDGQDGQDGTDGLSSVIKGSDTQANINALTTMVEGDIWILTDTNDAGNGLRYDGTAWVNIGPLKGEDGQDGQDGTTALTALTA